MRSPASPPPSRSAWPGPGWAAAGCAARNRQDSGRSDKGKGYLRARLALGDLHHAAAASGALQFGRLARPDLQAQPRGQTTWGAWPVRQAAETIRLDSRDGLPLGERSLCGRTSELARAEISAVCRRNCVSRCLGFRVCWVHCTSPIQNSSRSLLLVDFGGLLIVSALECLVSFRMKRLIDRENRGQCVHCGYDLRATPDRCPECGTIPTGATSGNLTPLPSAHCDLFRPRKGQSASEASAQHQIQQ